LVASTIANVDLNEDTVGGGKREFKKTIGCWRQEDQKRQRLYEYPEASLKASDHVPSAFGRL